MKKQGEEQKSDRKAQEPGCKAQEPERRGIMEKVYKTMRITGAASIAVGIIMIVVGVSTGIISIISGAVLFKKKSELTF